jgi:uroporphyrinogen-III synthase
MQILLTRPLEDSRALAEKLESEGISPLIWPLTRIVPTVMVLKLPFTTDALLFTSANGVRALAALVERRDLPALCVGKATAQAARKAGFRDCFAASGDARALADLARRSGIRQFFHPRGADAAGDIKGWLAETVWSPRGAKILARHLASAGAALEGSGLLAISPAAAGPLATSGFGRVFVAQAPNAAAMLAEIRSYCAGTRQ